MIDAELLTILTELRDGLRRVEHRLDDLAGESSADRLSRVLPAVAGALGSAWFTVSDALDYPAVAALGMLPSELGYLLYTTAKTKREADGLRVEQHDKKINNASQFRIVKG